MNVTVLVDGAEVFNRDVDSVECEQTAAGALNMQAAYPRVETSGPPTGTLVEFHIPPLDEA